MNNLPHASWFKYLHLHFIVFIWGFTGILGKLITIGALELVWLRLLISVFLLWGIAIYKRSFSKEGFRLKYFLNGIIVALHWITFYAAIKLSNVSVALSAFASTAFFTSMLEPLIFKRRIQLLEVFPGILVIGGMYIIYQSEFAFANGIWLGILAAFTSSLFATFNGKWAHETQGMEISLSELTAALGVLTLIIGIVPEVSFPGLSIGLHNWLWLIVLAVICTVYPFVATIRLLKHFKPFMLSLTVNLEPIYSIVLAYLIFGESEKMTGSFYIGGAITLGAVFLYPLLKKRKGNSERIA